MPDLTFPIGRTITLDVATRGETSHLPQAVRNGDLIIVPDHLADRLIARLTARMVAERLPSQEQTFVVDDPRWATWWDHLKASVRGRWWAQAYVRRHPPRTVLTTVRCRFDVRAQWLFPDTPVPRPGLGRPVLYTTTEPWQP